MRIVLISILLVLTGCETLSPEERERRAELRQLAWQEECVAFIERERACNRSGGFMAINVRGGTGTLRNRGKCPRSITDMRHAECADSIAIWDGNRPVGVWR